MSAAPLGYLDAAGQRADTILPLTWFTLIVSLLVCTIIAILLWIGVRRAQSAASVSIVDVPVSAGGKGLHWITVGLLISAVPIFITLVWTMVALAVVSGPPAHPGVTLDVTAHQWWWEVRYDSKQPSEIFSTANEIHIPVGVAVLVRLHGGDVIHSFWVPKLSGKTDAIPGQTNLSWLQAQRPGRYSGQCTEYCGAQHANMGLEVVAQSPADFQRWRTEQLQPAAAPISQTQRQGLAVVEYRCGLCHQVRGTRAGAVSAPDLTHLMSRRTIAAGRLVNSPGALVAWIQNAQELKPGSLMPDQFLSGSQLLDVRAYLETLK
ncbi:MAG TPA: cytochrome c oxidase subunit II [Steroidobacteraceae bacterium]|nr:cytochrome c oxidase subunit II [Steroidobacteraceae bacterium]